MIWIIRIGSANGNTAPYIFIIYKAPYIPQAMYNNLRKNHSLRKLFTTGEGSLERVRVIHIKTSL